MRIKQKRQFICGSLFLLALAVIVLIRNFYSFCWSDESLYISQVHQLYIGERPFVDGWHPTQFYTPLLLPLYHIYVGIKGSAEGIYLWSRIFNLILAFLSAELSYYVLRKYFALENWLSAAGGAIIMLYCRANVGGLSYHNFFFFNFIMAVMLAYMGMCRYRTNTGCRKYAGICYVSGLLCGMAIITIPTCVFAVGVVYIGFTVCVIRKKPIEKRHPLWFHIGGALSMGTAYALWVFSRIKITEFFHMLPYLFDEDHEPKNITVLLGNIWDVTSSLGRDILIVTVVVCMIRMFFFMRYKKNREWMMAALYGLAAVSVAITLIRLSDSHMSAYAIFPMLGIALFVLNTDGVKMKALLQSDKNVFLFVPALVIIVTFALGSATIDTTYGGGVFCGLIVLMEASKFASAFKDRKYKFAVNCVTMCVLAVLLGMLMKIRITTVYRDAPLAMLDTKITQGPAKGLWTTKEHAGQYNACLRVMNYIDGLENEESDCVLISVLAPWMYVCTDVHSGGFSVWRNYMDAPLLEEYYRYHNIENLKYVIVLDEAVGNFTQAGNVEGTDDSPNRNDEDGFLWNYIRNNAYEKVEFECGVLYVRE